ncbi:flagellar biosynthetic protein FliO [Citricoccus sp. K5]|mgnify:CR=1 FL=1|uniref:FliO/MopB family protein n=1 Tax=Citricoccus sp. K5 TaxID=2653135 RepID=UPI0012EF3A07|nr:flagellar biosynthetic protein FliO [Citricoccus sp. K5]VXB63203.1 conserved hypothetical protein [Citricoccus sp. K5]
MGFGQILQVVLSLGIVALALYLSARVARRRFGAGGEDALRVISRQSVSRTQNLVVVETNGHRHLVALTDGGAHTVETWDAPAAEAQSVVSGVSARREPIARRESAAHRDAAGASGFAATLSALTAGTQWSGLGRKTSASEGTRP